MNKLNIIVSAALIGLLIFSLGHSSGYDNAKESQQMYCKMVTEGTWPDYNQNFERICE